MSGVAAGIALAALLSFAPPASAQDSAEFGAWRAVCAPTAGCALGASAPTGDRLVFSEPDDGDRVLLFVPIIPVQRGSLMTLTLDGSPAGELGPGDGWRIPEIDTSEGAVELSPTLTREELMPRMLRRDTLEIRYITETGTEREVRIPLRGYSDARGYADTD